MHAREGFIQVWRWKNKESNFEVLKVHLKYVHGSPVIREIKRISNLADELFKIWKFTKSINGLGISIIQPLKDSIW